MYTVAENLMVVRERIQEACFRSGRNTDEVRLMGVTKYVDTARIGEALDAGLTIVGENHAQELREKLTFYKLRGCEIHFIGQLQTNKVKYLLGEAYCIDSVDRIELAETISKRALIAGTDQKIMVEVNIGEEPQKGGVLPDRIMSFFDRISELDHLEIHGIMCVPPAGTDPRPYFRKMRALFERIHDDRPSLPIDTLSMGMSADYPIAVEEGATTVRVGSAIFGARDRK